MLVTSQLPIETTNFAIISFQRALVPPHFEKGSVSHGNVILVTGLGFLGLRHRAQGLQIQKLPIFKNRN